MNARTGVADHEYVLRQDGRRVVLPRTGREENHRAFAYEPTDVAALARFKEASLRGRARPVDRDPEIEVGLVVERTAPGTRIVVAAPERFGGDVRRRRVGELSGSWGFSLGTALTDLARAFDEIVCTGVLHRGEYLYLDIPRPSVLVPAIRTFFTRHAGPGAGPGGPGRRSIADPVRRHTEPSEFTEAALGRLRTFPELRPIGAVTFRTRQGWASPRCIELVDAASGRVLGEVAMGHLFLEDERHRADLLDVLDAARIPAARPLDEPFACDDDAWPDSRVPNMWTYWFVQGLELRSRNPADPRSSTSLAYYNPTYRRLWVEDSRLLVPACVYAARLGIEIADVGVPPRPWTLEEEVPFYELKDASLKLRTRHDVAVQPQLLDSVRDLVPDDLFPAEDVTWHSAAQPVPYHPEAHRQFLQHERHVHERAMLFGAHKPTAKVQPCGLCGRPSRAFTATISTDRLGYCQECLRHAALGALRTVRRKRVNRIRAARALTLLGQHEFGGVPMLEAQLDTLHVDPRNPVPARDIDRLLLVRFAIARGQYPWTHLLEEAGFGEDGLRTATSSTSTASPTIASRRTRWMRS